MDETRTHATRGYYSRTFAYTPNPLEGGFWGREFEFSQSHKNKKDNRSCPFVFAVWTRLELATPCVTGRYSNQLNYHTVLVFFSVTKVRTFFNSAKLLPKKTQIF